MDEKTLKYIRETPIDELIEHFKVYGLKIKKQGGFSMKGQFPHKPSPATCLFFLMSEECEIITPNMARRIYDRLLAAGWLSPNPERRWFAGKVIFRDEAKERPELLDMGITFPGKYRLRTMGAHFRPHEGKLVRFCVELLPRENQE